MEEGGRRGLRNARGELDVLPLKMEKGTASRGVQSTETHFRPLTSRTVSRYGCIVEATESAVIRSSGNRKRIRSLSRGIQSSVVPATTAHLPLEALVSGWPIPCA